MAPVAPISALMQNAQDMLGRQQQEEATLRAASFAASSALQEAQVSPNWLSSSLMCHFVAHISLMILQQPVRKHAAPSVQPGRHMPLWNFTDIIHVHFMDTSPHKPGLLMGHVQPTSQTVCCDMS